jgi:hypothetical protein
VLLIIELPICTKVSPVAVGVENPELVPSSSVTMLRMTTEFASTVVMVTVPLVATPGALT